MSWVKDLVQRNPQGVMNVLSEYGYQGYLAPQNQEELFDAASLAIEQNGEEAVDKLLMANPEFNAGYLKGKEEKICNCSKNNINTMDNATQSNLINELKSLVSGNLNKEKIVEVIAYGALGIFIYKAFLETKK